VRLAAPNVATLDVAALLGPDAAALRGRARRWRLLLWLLPDGAAARLARRGLRVEDAALLFTAGRTGRAKAVPLEHHGVHCNVDAVRELLAPTEHDVIVSLLPTSLATGFSHGLWLPLLGHSRALLVPDPRDGHAVGAAITHASATILLATPRLLEVLLHSAKPDHLGSLRLIIVLGEALRPALREALTARFGLSPLEALSSTECSGFIALGTPDVRVPGIFHRGSKPGSVGHPLTGLSLEVVDPQTGALLPNGEPGQLRVRGPSVVRGYLDDPELTARSFREGWFLSGEEALIDEDGFVTVTERFGRSTILGGQFGAERVSHAALEEAILALLGTPDAPVVVVEAAGPRLVVVFLRGKLEPARVVEGLRTAGWHEPALPRERDFVAVDTLPLLPTGLLDLRALQRAAEGAV
jgi:acyl-[acyl-carrier-protein]-phospholipid O-acyltransferase/long-chain-fatty-acid--[acyl-carrier-protein] ligase